MQNQANSLEIVQDERVIYQHRGNWLHPLLDLEQHISGLGVSPSSLLLRDKIIGKAAALLVVRLGFRRVEAGVISELGREVFLAHGVEHRWEKLIERIACRTEQLLLSIDDPEVAHRIIVGRIERDQ